MNRPTHRESAEKYLRQRTRHDGYVVGSAIMAMADAARLIDTLRDPRTAVPEPGLRPVRAARVP